MVCLSVTHAGCVNDERLTKLLGMAGSRLVPKLRVQTHGGSEGCSCIWRGHTVECRIKRRPPPAEHAHGLVLPTPGNCRGGPRPDRTRKRTMMKRKICDMISSTRSTGRRRSRKRGRKQREGWRGKFWEEMMMNSHTQEALLACPRRGTSCNS